MKPAADPSKAPPRWAFVVVTLITFLVNWGADRATKDLATAFLQGREPLSYLYDVVVLRYAVNTGAFLSLGQDWPVEVKTVVLLVVPLLVCLGALGYAAFRERSLTRAMLIVTIAAGGVGNLADRLFNGFQVVDFLNFGIGPLRTGILNVADLSVTFGALAFLWLGSPRRAKTKGKGAP